MSIEGQGRFFTLFFPGFVCFVHYLDKISGERLQDHWSSGLFQVVLMFCLFIHRQNKYNHYYQLSVVDSVADMKYCLHSSQVVTVNVPVICNQGPWVIAGI